jgi:glycogen debranching enzyme
MARYGERDGVVRLMSDLFDAAVNFDMRLPELFCGFPRRGAGDDPVGYPVACMPQAWASGAAFMMLQACLGVTIDHRTGVRIDKPRLPVGVDQLEIRNVDVAGRKTTLTFQRIGTGVVAYSDQHLGGSVPFAGTGRAD